MAPDTPLKVIVEVRVQRGFTINMTAAQAADPESVRTLALQQRLGEDLEENFDCRITEVYHAEDDDEREDARGLRWAMSNDLTFEVDDPLYDSPGEAERHDDCSISRTCVPVVVLDASKPQPLPEPMDVLRRLVQWAEHTGGWEAPIWDEAKALVARSPSSAT